MAPPAIQQKEETFGEHKNSKEEVSAGTGGNAILDKE
jgi:hypothetical protein